MPLYEANDLLLIDQYILVCEMFFFGSRWTEKPPDLLSARYTHCRLHSRQNSFQRYLKKDRINHVSS